jgi:hypothetical protein
MPQIELRPFMARTMVEDGERVKPFAAPFAAWRESHGSGQSARRPVEKFAIVLLVVAANGSLPDRRFYPRYISLNYVVKPIG